jgi:putative transposase
VPEGRDLDPTFSKWLTKPVDLEVSDMKKVRQLEEENRRFKQKVAEQVLDSQALKAVTSKHWGIRRNRSPLRG